MFITTIYVVKVYKLSVGDANPFGTKTFYFMNQNDKETFLDYLDSLHRDDIRYECVGHTCDTVETDISDVDEFLGIKEE